MVWLCLTSVPAPSTQRDRGLDIRSLTVIHKHPWSDLSVTLLCVLPIPLCPNLTPSRLSLSPTYVIPPDGRGLYSSSLTPIYCPVEMCAWLQPVSRDQTDKSSSAFFRRNISCLQSAPHQLWEHEAGLLSLRPVTLSVFPSPGPQPSYCLSFLTHLFPFTGSSHSSEIARTAPVFKVNQLTLLYPQPSLTSAPLSAPHQSKL